MFNVLVRAEKRYNENKTNISHHVDGKLYGDAKRYKVQCHNVQWSTITKRTYLLFQFSYNTIIKLLHMEHYLNGYPHHSLPLYRVYNNFHVYYHT